MENTYKSSMMYSDVWLNAVIWQTTKDLFQSLIFRNDDNTAKTFTSWKSNENPTKVANFQSASQFC